MSDINNIILDSETTIISDDKREIENGKKEDDMEGKLDKLLLELKILSNVKEFDKLSVRDNLVIDSPHILQCITRKMCGDSRDKTISFIDTIINEIFSILDFLLEEEIEKAQPITIMKTPQYSYNTKKNNKTNKNCKTINFKDDTINIYQTINQNLTESIGGLQNLKITYLHDITMTSKLDMLIVKIQNRISKINNMMVLNP